VAVLWAEPNVRRVPRRSWRLEDQISATPDRSLKLQLGDVVTRNMALQGHIRVPYGVECLLDVLLRPNERDLESVYAKIASSLREIPESALPLVLECLARDCSRLLPYVIGNILEQLIKATWHVRPSLYHFARAIVGHYHFQTKSYVPSIRELLRFGTYEEWVRAFTSALIQRNRASPDETEWPADVEGLTFTMGAQVAAAVELADELFTPYGAVRPVPGPAVGS
jgi:hypothetical protein